MKKWVVLGVALLALFLAPSAAFATTYDVTDYGATVDSSTPDNDSLGIQAAVNRCRLDGGGGTIYFPPGHYELNTPIVLYPNQPYTGFDGDGVTINLLAMADSDQRRFFVLGPNTEPLTPFQNFEFWGFTVDCQQGYDGPNDQGGENPPRHYFAVFGFDSYDGTGGDSWHHTHDKSLNNFSIHDITMVNLPTSIVSAYNSAGLEVCTYPADYDQTFTINDLRIENVHIEGAQRGIVVDGVEDLANPIGEVEIHDLVIRGCWHDTMSEHFYGIGSSGPNTTSSIESANFRVGGHAKVDEVDVGYNYGANSGAVGIEVDSAAHATIHDNLVYNQYGAGYYVSNYHEYYGWGEGTQLLEWANNTDAVTREMDGGWGQSYGFQEALYQDIDLGDIWMSGCTYYLGENADDTLSNPNGPHRALFAPASLGGIVNHINAFAIDTASDTRKLNVWDVADANPGNNNPFWNHWTPTYLHGPAVGETPYPLVSNPASSADALVFHDGPSVNDTTAPTTRARTRRSALFLKVDDGAGTGGALTFFRLTQGGVTGAWQAYTTPIRPAPGTILEWYSYDKAGNRESVRTLTIGSPAAPEGSRLSLAGHSAQRRAPRRG